LTGCLVSPYFDYFLRIDKMKKCKTVKEQVQWIKRVFNRIRDSWSITYNWSFEKSRAYCIVLIDRLNVLQDIIKDR